MKQHKPFCKPIVLLFCLGTISLFSQDILWEKSMGGKHADYLSDAQPTADFGFILGGSSYSGSTGRKNEDSRGNLDYWLWKMDEHGKEEWQKTFGGMGMDLLRCVRVTPDGGIILGGQSSSDANGDKTTLALGGEDIWVLKLDAKGGVEWQLSLGGSGQEMLHSLMPTADGGYILGASSSSNAPDETVMAHRNGHSDKSKIILKDSDSFGHLDYWIIKLDNKGDLQWQRSFGGQYADQLRAIVQTPDGGYVAGGNSNSPEAITLHTGAGIPKSEKCYGSGDYWIIRLDKSGNPLWQKVYGGEGDDQLEALILTEEGHIVMAGNSDSGTTGNKNTANGKGTDFWVLETDEMGNILWQRTYDTGKIDILTSLLRNSDGTLLMGGYAKSETKGTKKKDREGVNDYILLKTKANGEQLWKKTTGSNGEDVLKKAIETRDGGYLLCGTSSGELSRDRESSVGRNDFWIVKLLDRDKPKKEKEPVEAVPNPTAAYTNIITGFEFEEATLSVFDLSGRQLQSFAIQQRMVPLDLNGLPEGIYIVEVRSKSDKGSVKVMKKSH